MSIDSALIFQGGAESSEILEEAVQELMCVNGHKVKVMGDMLFTEKGMSTMASNKICPICNSPLQ